MGSKTKIAIQKIENEDVKTFIFEYAKELFRAMIKENINKKWCTQVTINMADDDELLRLAAKSGCFGVFIGFESSKREGLEELSKKLNIKKNISVRNVMMKFLRNDL